MVILYGVDRATGNDGETIREWRKRQRSTPETNETIADIDNLVSQGGCSLHNFDFHVDGDGHDNSPEQSGSPQEDLSPHANGASAKKKKKKRVLKEQENNLKESTEALYAMISTLEKGNEAIMQGNIALIKASNSKREVPQLSGYELCNMLEECGCDADKIPDIYCLLSGDDDKLRTAVNAPTSIRKHVIMKLFYGSQ